MKSNDDAVVVASSADRVTTLRLHRPERRNAIDDAVVAGLLAGLDDAEARGDRAVVLTGGDSFFSSGGDVASMPRADAGLFAAASRLARVHEVIRRIVRSDLPVVVAVERYAIGVAWGLALAGDLLLAADDAFFSAPFAQRGLTADGGAGFHLPARLGHQRAARLLLLGERLPATEALAAGLVTELVPAGTATARAQAIAASLAGGPTESNALTKRQLNHDRAPALESFLAAERTAVALAGHGANAAEGRAAFTERREPDFS